MFPKLKKTKDAAGAELVKVQFLFVKAKKVLPKTKEGSLQCGKLPSIFIN